jgi:hypothetical protein
MENTTVRLSVCDTLTTTRPLVVFPSQSVQQLVTKSCPNNPILVTTTGDAGGLKYNSINCVILLMEDLRMM